MVSRCADYNSIRLFFQHDKDYRHIHAVFDVILSLFYSATTELNKNVYFHMTFLRELNKNVYFHSCFENLSNTRISLYAGLLSCLADSTHSLSASSLVTITVSLVSCRKWASSTAASWSVNIMLIFPFDFFTGEKKPGLSNRAKAHGELLFLFRKTSFHICVCFCRHC